MLFVRPLVLLIEPQPRQEPFLYFPIAWKGQKKDLVVSSAISDLEESQVHGRDGDKKYVLNKILWQRNDAQVVVIVGVGGIGKTTLAQLVYNDEKVREKFDYRIWVCVSNPFDEVKVAQGILEGIRVDHNKLTHLQSLHESIKESLYERTFLLVLDDVWDEDFRKWERLQMCLKFGNPESRVVVTTRSEKVAKIMSSTPTNIFKPALISSLDCWLLMRETAFQGKRREDCIELEDIGKMVANKCKGLPLAAKVLGGLLRSKDTLKEWEEVLNSEIWGLEKAEMELFPHLFLSYKELPPSLKRCFSICAIFPKDYSIDVEQLISLWMSQIHLNLSTIEDNMMLTGQRYIKFLKSGAFFEEGNRSDLVKMHDIMHDFALHRSGHEFLSLDSSEPEAYAKNMKARHLFVDGTMNQTSFGDLGSICDVGKLRTCYIEGLQQNVALDLFKQLKVVRALYLQFCDLKEVPEEIGRLIHLRTLDLSNNQYLRRLPETIGELYNLQFLWLDGLGLLPKSICKLINLQRLKQFSVEKGKSNLGILKSLNKLGGALEIVFNSAYADEADAKDAKLTSKKHITELSFDFRGYEVANGVFEALEAPPGVQLLNICRFMGQRFLPDWITSLSHLKELRLSDAAEALSIPPLGKLPAIERLYIEDFSVLKFIGREFLGIEDNPTNKLVGVAFPKLLTLIFLNCPKLEEWEDIKAEDEDAITVMPKLKCLLITGCHSLKVLPHRLIHKAASLEEFTFPDTEPSLSFSVQPLPDIKLLNITYWKGKRLPNWILSFNHLMKLHIKDAFHVEYLPALGKLPCLQDLYISNFSIIQSIGREFLGMDNNKKESDVVFPKLVIFRLDHSDKWNKWEDIEDGEAETITVMPTLESLTIKWCAKLEALPSRLLCKAPRLKKLTINTRNSLLEDSIKEDQQLMMHIQKIHVNDTLLIPQPKDTSSMYCTSDQQ